MAWTGGCACGAVRYEATGEPEHSALCHCRDCRRHAGALAVGWVAFRAERVAITGQPVEWSSNGISKRRFCGRCGTGLFFENGVALPGLIDIQQATLDDPEALAPAAHIQAAERLSWMVGLEALPSFDRYPGM